jgi:AcrR family transcriptional regulator
MTRERSDDKRQAILDAALSLFVEKHFHGTSVPEIAARAGVADGTIYRYFISKEALVNELYVLRKRELVAFVARPFRPGMSVKERLVEIGERFMVFAETAPLVVFFLERNHHESYLYPEALAEEVPLVQLIISLLEEGKSQGIIKDIRNEVLMFVLYGALTGIVEANRRGLIRRFEDVKKEVEECLWHAIRA